MRTGCRLITGTSFTRPAITAMLMASAAGIALAHATLRRAEPPSGGHVSQPPRELRLEFTESVSPGTSRVDLVTPDSQRFALQLTGDRATPNVLVAQVPPLRIAGLFRVEWRLVGADGHAVTGKYGFTVDSIRIPSDSAPGLALEETRTHQPTYDSAGQQAVRFAASVMLVLVIGSVAFALFVLPAVVRADPAGTRIFETVVDDRLRSLCVAASWSILALGLVRLVNHAATLSGSIAAISVGDVGDLIARSSFGRGWMLQMSAAFALVLVLRVPGAARWRVMAGISVVMAVSAALLGHPAAVTGMPLVAVGLDSVHVLSAGGWAGAILVISLAILPQVMRVPADHRLLLARNLLSAFSPLALTCAALLAVTGAASAWLQLRDPGLLFASPYGLAVVRKLVVVLMMAALGAYHWRVAHRSLNTERSITHLRRSIALDVVLVLLVLVLTAILTGTTTPAVSLTVPR